ncbi:IucA/IucC family protein [Nocardioides antri]|uniref:Siderophore biosynthesis protein n=1 Tax=Nocardioides antri TaxID=2607659 RepID=A0A5B1M642_9ACTN|nr:IucA/IucC family protein [Nocardioides antri]KAA1428204.1 siderophore biosynthesis protein [Nocardioides antri]
MTAVATPSRSAEVARERATRVAVDVLLRCWLRETGEVVTGTGEVVVPLPGARSSLRVQVAAFSPSGAHTFGTVLDERGHPVAPAELADLLAREAARRTGRADHTEARDRMVESVRRAEGYAARRALEEDPPNLPGWLLAEQDLLSGHPWHPMTKSRDGLADDLDARFSPEARGTFPLHWYAASPEVAASGGAGLDVSACLRELAGAAAADVPMDWLMVPAHPWQAADLPARPAAADLLDRGLLRDLGAHGDPWWATSSLRTVARPGAHVMLKLSMGLRVTNSRRENTRDEGLLAVHTARLVDAGLGCALAAAHPAFGLVLDRGWLGVDGPGPVGLETVLRDVPFDPAADVRCAGSVLDPRPDLARPPAADLVRRAANAHGIAADEAAVLWFRRWLDVVVEPLLWLHGTWGIGLEAHLQNVLVGFGDDGVPTHGWYRDNQGWYAASSAVDRLAQLMPDVGRDAPLVFDDRLVIDRVAYYLGVNHVLGVAAAVAHATAVAEERLLAELAGMLDRHLGRPSASPVADLLLHADTLPTKANLLTGVDGRDEVESPVETQSLYVEIPNPLREVRR